MYDTTRNQQSTAENGNQNACYINYRSTPVRENHIGPDVYEAAVSDPRLFLSQFPRGVIIDEVQRFPALFSYIQTMSDERNRPGEYILTGSQNFLLSEKISQSLAGRVFVTHLLPLSISELRSTDEVKSTESECH